MYALTLNTTFLAMLPGPMPEAARLILQRLCPYMTQPVEVPLLPDYDSMLIASWQLAKQLDESRKHNKELQALAFKALRAEDGWPVPQMLNSCDGIPPGRLLLFTANLRRGLGDIIMLQPIFRAQAQHLAARGWPEKLSISSSNEFAVLFHGQPFIDIFIPEFPALSLLAKYDYAIEYGLALKRMRHLVGAKDWLDIDLEVRLHAPEPAVQKWAGILADDAMKIFVNWASFDKHRTLSPDFFRILRDAAPKAAFYTSLHKNPVQGEVFPGGPENLSDRGETLTDLLGILANMDIVITTNTGVAHMAAGLGKPTIVLFFGRLEGWDDYWPDLHEHLYPTMVPVGYRENLALGEKEMQAQTLRQLELLLCA